uniref:Sulfatase-modifying factor enzyme-like domain-containing protein n=1 Tax=Cyanothece sp. (strain PCC 7425 / ATCC 29141) TaxID=395961 RepID=B8HLX3_CYAP4
MPQCPVCQTSYAEGAIERCQTCDWDLRPYPLMVEPLANVKPQLGRSVHALLLEAIPPLSARTEALVANFPPQQRQYYHFQVSSLNPQGQPQESISQTTWGYREPLSNNLGLDMVAIPAGQFLMGSPGTEAERETAEGPLHPVALSPFLIGRFPITQAQWRRVASLPRVHRSLNPNPSYFAGDDLPVEQISWHDAIEFCDRLSQATGRRYRLPSEAEWEYACRAGTTTPFHWGETLNSDLANYDGNYTYGQGPPGVYRQRTTPIKTFAIANPFGLFDLHGNVWEWCADHWQPDYQGAPADGRAWLQSDGNYRVLRGGAWYCLPNLCRSAQRHWDQVDHGGSGMSFRVACSWA